MMIRDIIQKQGEVIFRYRGYIPLFILPVMLFVLQDSEWIELQFGDLVDDVYDWACFGISMAGIVLRVATVGFLPRRTSGRNTRKGQVADELNTTGMYSIVRHPLYLANTVILIGFLLATGSFLFTMVGLLACCLHYERVTCAEESFLLDQYGVQYSSWADTTPAFFPQTSLWIPPKRQFCWRTALKREYQTAFGVIIVFTLLDYVEDLLALGSLELEVEMTALFLFASVVFLLLRYLHKKTRLLHVAGR